MGDEGVEWFRSSGNVRQIHGKSLESSSDPWYHFTGRKYISKCDKVRI